ncbi:MAG: DUF2304 domain-containing protein [Chiayiivirga sp.]|jgi:hypothetical protein|uniref:DUF2304 domain-containing protein n=1 Tax=Chiayiivirga sp. TaxID=2041042 RepID=UPI0025C27D54|nr:DUF2304 domain-containing protein [Chiayiivirga sp.]MCI1710361.1 DUF2304 domain-containing protein [Chiayiivirga sp.]MCI1728857.1 DUF2304 domain-containing protein [Chiayiivirga sp.]
MTSYYLTSVALGVVLALGILWLVRRDHLHGSYALWWLAIALAALAVGFYPAIVDWIGVRLGVAYPPMLLAMVAIVAILLKLLGVDVDVTRRERRLRRLLQKVALLELELKQLREEREADARRDAAPAAHPPSVPETRST